MKKCGNICLIVILSILITAVSFSFTSKKIMVQAISTFYTKDRIVGSIIGEINNEKTLNATEINSLKTALSNSDCFDKISEKYYKGIVDYYVYNKTVNSIDIKDELAKIVDNCKTYYCNNIKANIYTVNLDYIFEYCKLNLDNIVDNDKVMLLTIYNVFTGKVFRIINIILIIVMMALLYFINRKNKKRLMLFSSLFYTTFGVSTLLLIILGIRFKTLSTELINRSYYLNYTSLYVMDALLLITAIVLNVLYENKKKTKKHKK